MARTDARPGPGIVRHPVQQRPAGVSIGQPAEQAQGGCGIRRPQAEPWSVQKLVGSGHPAWRPGRGRPHRLEKAFHRHAGDVPRQPSRAGAGGVEDKQAAGAFDRRKVRPVVGFTVRRSMMSGRMPALLQIVRCLGR